MMKNLSKKIIIVFSFILVTSCTAQKINKRYNEDIVAIFNLIYINSKQNGNEINELILVLSSTSENIAWIDFISEDYLVLIKDYKARNKDELVEFEKVLNESEIDEMKAQVSSNKNKSWKSILGNSKELGDDSSYVKMSFPVFNKDRSFALFYIEYGNSGSLAACRKVNGNWEQFGTGLIWIE